MAAKESIPNEVIALCVGERVSRARPVRSPQAARAVTDSDEDMVKTALTITLSLALGSGIAYEHAALTKPHIVMDSALRLSHANWKKTELVDAGL